MKTLVETDLWAQEDDKGNLTQVMLLKKRGGRKVTKVYFIASWILYSCCKDSGSLTWKKNGTESNIKQANVLGDQLFGSIKEFLSSGWVKQKTTPITLGD